MIVEGVCDRLSRRDLLRPPPLRESVGELDLVDIVEVQVVDEIDLTLCRGLLRLRFPTGKRYSRVDDLLVHVLHLEMIVGADLSHRRSARREDDLSVGLGGIRLDDHRTANHGDLRK